MRENETEMFNKEFDLYDLVFEFVDDKDLEEIAGGIKIGSIYIK